MMRWSGNSTVTVMTVTCEIVSFTQAKRNNWKERKEVLLIQPNVIHQYDQYMGGVEHPNK